MTHQRTRLDRSQSRLFRLGSDGVFESYAGSHAGAPLEGYRANVELMAPAALAVARTGEVYLSEQTRHRIVRIGIDGQVTTVAGFQTGTCASSPDPLFARTAPVCNVYSMAVSDDGELYFTDSTTTPNAFIRRISKNGYIFVVAGKGVSGESEGEDLPANAEHFSAPQGIALSPNGAIYVGDLARVRRLEGAQPWLVEGENFIVSKDQDELFVFDAQGRHLRTLDTITGSIRFTFQYDSAGHVIHVTDRDGRITTIQRDGSGHPTAIVGPYGQVTTLGVDSAGLMTSVTSPAAESYQFAYNADGILSTLTTPRTQTHQFTYDALGRLSTDSNPRGTVTLSSTVPRGVILPPEDGELLRGSAAIATRTTAEGRAHQYESIYIKQRLGESRRRKVKTPVASIESKVDTFGREVTKFPDGTETQAEARPSARFGIRAQLPTTTERMPSGLERTVSVSEAVSTANPTNPLAFSRLQTRTSVTGSDPVTTEYEASSRTWKTSDSAGRESRLVISAQGRPVQVRRGSLLPINFEYDTEGKLLRTVQGTRETNFAYDSLGRLFKTTDALGQVTFTSFDAANRLSTITRPDGLTIELVHDAMGNLTRLRNSLGRDHDFTYDSVDLLSGYTAPLVGSQPSLTEQTYDRDHALTSIVYPGGQSLALGYDGGGRVSTISHPATSVSVGYTPGNHVAQMTQAGGGLAFTYDGSLVTAETSAFGTLEYAYDNQFRVTQLRIADLNVPYVYNPTGLLIGAGALTMSYASDRRALRTTTLGHSTSSIDYNDYGEQSATTWRHNGAVAYAEQYSRDNLGRVQTRTIMRPSQPARTFTYHYDVLNRLTETLADGVSIERYAYDANGNRTGVTTPTLGTRGAMYDAQDRLVTFGDATYTYTAFGALRTKTTPAGITEYTYDVLGNLRGVDLPNGDVITYAIDPLNRRTAKYRNGIFVQGFIYDGPRVVAELDGSGSIVKRFVYGSRAHVPDYMVGLAGITYRIITDHLGSPVKVIEVVDGTVQQDVSYDAFGNVLTDTGPGFTPFGFAGGVYDRDTQLVRFGARDYDPETGRWTTKDPIGFDGGDPNLYGYVVNDPINFIDPEGTNPLLALALACAGGGCEAAATAALAATATLASVIAADLAADWWNSYAKQTRQTGKEKADDKPSWVQEKPAPGESGKEFAKRLLDRKYGPGNYDKGPKTEFNQIKKYGDRCSK